MLKIKDAINKILWSEKDIERYYIVIVDRAEVSGTKKIPLSRVARVDNNYIYVADALGEEHPIPLHRVIKIIKDDEIVFERNTRKPKS
ncbi:MAG: RNA repair domain-containing protein [Ignisphaera sp.]